MVKIIGHRGGSGEMPENTLMALQHCKTLGIAGAELDLRFSKDGKIIVIHDSKVDRTTNGKGNVSAYSYEELRSLDAGHGQVIPFLDEVLDFAKNHGLELFLEIKCENMEERLVELIKKTGLMSKCHVKCFDHRVIKKIKELEPCMQTACLLVARPVNPPAILRACRADILSINLEFVDLDLVKECHQAGYGVFVWNVDEKELLEKYKLMGVDYIGTNLPAKLLNKTTL